jgi:hypothetical protein
MLYLTAFIIPHKRYTCTKKTREDEAFDRLAAQRSIKAGEISVVLTRTEALHAIKRAHATEIGALGGVLRCSADTYRALSDVAERRARESQQDFQALASSIDPSTAGSDERDVSVMLDSLSEGLDIFFRLRLDNLNNEFDSVVRLALNLFSLQQSLLTHKNVSTGLCFLSTSRCNYDFKEA